MIAASGQGQILGILNQMRRDFLKFRLDKTATVLQYVFRIFLQDCRLNTLQLSFEMKTRIAINC